MTTENEKGDYDRMLDELLAKRHEEVLTWVEPWPGMTGEPRLRIDVHTHLAMTVDDAIAYWRHGHPDIKTDRRALDEFIMVNHAVPCPKEEGTGRAVLPAYCSTEPPVPWRAVTNWLMTGAGRHWLSWQEKPTVDGAIAAMLGKDGVVS